MRALTVSRAEAGQKLLNFLLRRVDAPQGELHRWIRSGQVRRNMGRAKAFERVEEGDAVRLPPFARLRPVDGQPRSVSRESAEHCPEPGLARKEPDRPPLGIFHEDGDVLVLAKPAGLPSQGGTGYADSLASRLAGRFAGAAFVPAPAHRLDKDTSGLILAGKTYAAQRTLADAFAGRGPGKVIKDYLAWVWGDWKTPGVTHLADRLEKDARGGKALPPESEAGAGREARSLVAALRRVGIGNDAASLLLIRLLTGRTHQIRVQLSGRGFPLAGDPKYGDRAKDGKHGVPGLMLHACHLVLPAPLKGEFALPPPWRGGWAAGDLPVFHEIFSAIC